MSSDRWRRVEGLYHAALERSAAERSAFVAAACRGDAALEREVRSLLDQESVPGFLSEPAIEVAAQLVDGSSDAAWIGRRIGVYTIDELLGKGGMGEVYRARDGRLRRDVAIKVLPKAFAANPERLARFEREARLLAALNHPNIGAIHGVEEGDDVLALVLELVEGETLADRIADRPVAIKDALNWACQIADALDSAHEKGIIHRDLKPANIKITPQRVVKVLDFGLARAAGIGSEAGDLTRPPTITATSGIILGTAAYMSPEQARGQAVDKRTDIWAFGCVLYELLTGRPAFAGPTTSDTIAAILQREPDWGALPPDLPLPVTTLLHRCLEKDPRRRRRDIGDVRAELDDAIAGPAPVDIRPAAAVPRSTLRTALPWTVTFAAVIAAAATTFWPRSWQSPLADAQFIRLTGWSGAETDAALSPDGRFVAFLSDRDGPFHIYLHQIDTGVSTDITPQPPDANYRFASKGTRNHAFMGDGSQIWLAGGLTSRLQLFPLIGGGSPRPFLPLGTTNVAWSRDGKRIVYSSADDGDSLTVADSFGASPTQIYISERGLHNHGPVWGSDGEWIYFIHGYTNSGELDVWRIRASGGKPQALTEHALDVGSLAPLDANTVLYTALAEDGSGPWLWSLDVDTKISRRLSSGLEQYTSVSASSDGRSIVAAVANPRAGLWVVPILDRIAEPLDVKAYGPPGVRALAPRVNGTALFYLSALGTGDGLWRFKDGRSTEIWKGSQGALLEPPAISPDGLRAAVVLRKGRRRTLTVVDVEGGAPQSLTDAVDVRGTAAWSPDGKWLVVGGVVKDQPGLFKVPSDGGNPIELRRGFAVDPAWSVSDLIAFSGENIGARAPLLVVRPNGEDVPLPPVLTAAEIGRPRFLADGSGIVFLEGRHWSPEFRLLDLKTKTTRQLTRIGGDSSQGQIGAFDVTPDGNIIFDRQAENSDIVLIKRPQ